MSDPKDSLSPIGGAGRPASGSPPAGGQMPTLGSVGGTHAAPSSAPTGSGSAPLGGVGGGHGQLLSNPPPAVRPPVSAPGTFNPGGQTGNAPVYVEESTGPSKNLIFGIGGGIAAVLLAYIAFMLFRTPPPVAAPTSFSAFTAADGTFSLDAPEGWTNQATGEAAGDANSTRQNGITMSSGHAQIELTMSTVAGLLSSQLIFGNEVVPESMGGSRASGIDKLHKPAIRNRYKNYKEKEVLLPPTKMAGAIVDPLTKEFKADGKLYEWTSDGTRYGFGGKFHGYRAVLAGSELIASVTCQCSERDWPKLKPAFLRVLASINEPNPEGQKSLGIPGAGNIPLPGSQ